MLGPGLIQRRIKRAFIANPGALLTTGDLVRWCRPRLTGRTLHKHRYPIRRAADAVGDRVGNGWRGSIIWRAKPSQSLSNGAAGRLIAKSDDIRIAYCFGPLVSET